MRLSRPLAGVAAVATILSLSACSVSDAEIHPGLAAEVDGAEITLDEVEEAVEATCQVLQADEQLLQGGYSGAELRGIVIQQLVITEVADSIAAEVGLDGEELQREAQRQARLSFGFAPEDDREAALPVFGASSYLTSVISEVVDPGLTEEELVDPGPAYQAYLEAWQAENDIDVNPRFDQVDFSLSAAGARTSDLSAAVSDAATRRAQLDELRARAAQGDTGAQAELTAVVGSLPESQACPSPSQAAPAEPEPTLPIPLENPGDAGE